MFHVCEFVYLPILVGFGFSFLYIQFLTIAVAVVPDISMTSVTLTIRLTTKEDFFSYRQCNAGTNNQKSCQ
jgi:hypothetical protein